jgi:hypothetical protein
MVGSRGLGTSPRSQRNVDDAGKHAVAGKIVPAKAIWLHSSHKSKGWTRKKKKILVEIRFLFVRE